MTSTIARLVLTTIAATVLQAVSGMALVGDRVPPPPGTPGMLLAWSLLSNGLTAGVLLGLARRARWSGLPLLLVLFAVAFGMALANIVEAVVFGVLRFEVGARIVAANALSSFLLCAVIAFMTPVHRRAVDDNAAGLPAPAAWRFGAVAVLYLVSYFSAGLLVAPFVLHFYQTVPPVGTVVLLQLLVRGPLFAGLIYLIVRALLVERTQAALWVGAAMAILGGIAPLLVPNALFPDEVRWAHLIEVGVSNSLFGMAAAWILRPLRGGAAPSFADAERTARGA